MATIIYSGNDPNAWLSQGVELGSKIGGVDSQIEIYDGSAAQAETYIAVDGTGSANLDSSNSEIRRQINKLQTKGLSGIGVGLEDGSNQTHHGRSTNGEIQSDVGIGAADELFVDFNRLSNQLGVELDLFFSREQIAWDPGIAAEQMQYRLLKEIPTAESGSLEIGGKHYEIVRNWTTQTATNTGRWAGGNNVGQDFFNIVSQTSFDAMIFKGADYTVATPSNLDPPAVDVSDYLLSKIELEESQGPGPQEEETFCFGGSDNLATWGDTTFAYRILGSSYNEVDSQTDINAIDPIQNNNDLGAMGSHLPTEATGLGVGRPSGGNSNDPVPNNPEIQGDPSQVSKGDALRMDFSEGGDISDNDGLRSIKAFSAEVTLSLFYSDERVELDPGTYAYYPERMKYQLARTEGNGYVNVGEEVLVNADDTGTFEYRTRRDPGNPGEFTFSIDSDEVFDTIIFKGANYGGGYDPSTDPSKDEVSDYLVKQVCLTGYDGDGSQSLNATAAADTFTFNTIADGKDIINGFNPSEDAIVISKSGFGLTGLDDFAAVLGSTAIADVSDYFTYSGGTLSVDLDASGSQVPVELATLTGNPSLTNLFFVA